MLGAGRRPRPGKEGASGRSRYASVAWTATGRLSTAPDGLPTLRAGPRTRCRWGGRARPGLTLVLCAGACVSVRRGTARRSVMAKPFTIKVGATTALAAGALGALIWALLPNQGSQGRMAAATSFPIKHVV